MKITQSTIFFIIIIVLVLGAIITFISGGFGGNNSTKYDSFVTCIKEKGVVFYGSSWCSHCNATKTFFGASKKLLPYVECSTSTGKQTQECKDKKIMGYPTWEFADGSRMTGEVTLKALGNLNTLAEKTSCQLPQ